MLVGSINALTFVDSSVQVTMTPVILFPLQPLTPKSYLMPDTNITALFRGSEQHDIFHVQQLEFRSSDVH
jgi:hypothetical protein